MTDLVQPRDHGGNLDAARARFGGARDEWLDLSTGINPCPYPVPDIPAASWANLPQKADQQALLDIATQTFGWSHDIIGFAGAQGAIQAMPQLAQRVLNTQNPDTCVLAPTYNEHAGAFISAGLPAREVADLTQLSGADVAIVVNPNNPDGRRITLDDLLALSKTCGLIVLDESFADVDPDNTLTAAIGRTNVDNVIILRSFGKFYGLAGVRLGFALARGHAAEYLRAQSGPWPISGPAIDIARAAYADTAWQAQTIERLRADSARLDALAQSVGWGLIGGCELFRTYAAPCARSAQDHLAEHAKIWTRIFPYSNEWIRFGLPADAQGWARLEAGFKGL